VEEKKVKKLFLNVSKIKAKIKNKKNNKEKLVL